MGIGVGRALAGAVGQGAEGRERVEFMNYFFLLLSIIPRRIFPLLYGLDLCYR